MMAVQVNASEHTYVLKATISERDSQKYTGIVSALLLLPHPLKPANIVESSQNRKGSRLTSKHKTLGLI